jgi:hypothetical protein
MVAKTRIQELTSSSCSFLDRSDKDLGRMDRVFVSADFENQKKVRKPAKGPTPICEVKSAVK